MKKLSCAIFIGTLFCLSPLIRAEVCADGSAPEAAVRGYLEGMKDYQFETAYDFVTDNMTDGRSREAWSELQLKFFVGGEVVIGKLDIRPAHNQAADDLTCASSAIVPHVLLARDKFNNQGSTEFELYTVVLEDGKWKIHDQKSLFHAEEVKQWFPNDEIPEFLNQL